MHTGENNLERCIPTY